MSTGFLSGLAGEAARRLTPFMAGPRTRRAEPLEEGRLIHDKISGSSRNPDNAGSYATILSYLGTAAKHGRNLHDTLVELFTTGPWLPPDAIPG